MKPPSENTFAQSISVNRGFSRQSAGYDQYDIANPILQKMRQQVYDHVATFLKPESSILELNAGTGIDALHFVKLGHRVLATDLSDGMVNAISHKIHINSVEDRMKVLQVSYEMLSTISGKKFDYVFSNFGGLNCVPSLTSVVDGMKALLNSGAHVTWVIMPRACPWEWLWTLKGQFAKAFRRFRNGGVMAHLEGEYFKTYYFSLSEIKTTFGSQFQFISSEGLCATSPPPHSTHFPAKYPRLYQWLSKMDDFWRKRFPFKRWGDHIIVTFRYDGNNLI